MFMSSLACTIFGCGIEIGVKENQAISSRPLASHLVNRGKLCPKGLSEHYTIGAENRGLEYPDIVEAAVAKKIRALWIIGTNLLVSYPNQGVLRHALSNLDFLVVQDGYH